MMNHHFIAYLRICLMFVLLVVKPAGANSPTVTLVPLGQVINTALGTFQLENGPCQAILGQIENAGDSRRLTLRTLTGRRRGKPVEDVSGIAWASKDLLVFTVSPIYGKPGLFIRSCSTGHTRTIIGPKTFYEGSPDGADYFQLQSLSLTAPRKIRFYYAPDVEKVDFYRFPSDDFLFEVNFDGTGLHKVVK